MQFQKKKIKIKTYIYIYMSVIITGVAVVVHQRGLSSKRVRDDLMIDLRITKHNNSVIDIF